MKNICKIYSRKQNGAIQSRFFAWLGDLGHLLFPVRCTCCGIVFDLTDKGHICDGCYAKLVFMGKPHCPVCGLMFMKSGGDSHICAGCRSKPPYFSRARSVLRYSEGIDKLIKQFKFKGDLSLVASFGQWFTQSHLSDGTPDYIVPVPLHTARIKVRGFNQSALLAKYFFRNQKHKIKHILERTVNTVPQTKLSGTERRTNLKNCFKLMHGHDVHDRLIYIVDDVYTTGTTVNECAKTLLDAGARRVEVFTLAMVVKENER